MTASRSVFFGLLLVAAGLVFVAARPGRAEEASGYDLRYLSITGEGSNAKAWFEGAAPGGAKVQEAIDRFAKEGYRLGSLAPAWRPGTVAQGQGSETYVLLLERKR
jgi:hypothetical protein